MTLTETAKPLKSNAYVATSNRGVDEWGVYFEFVELDNNTLSIIQKYCRVFIARNHVSFYERKAGTARTTWKPFTKGSPDEARAYGEKLLTRKPGNVMRGSAILVQLEPADQEMLDRGKSPAARYRATLRHQALFGTLETKQDAAPTSFDASGIAKAVEAIGSVKAAPVVTAPADPAPVLPPPDLSTAAAVPASMVPTPPSKATALNEPIDWSTVTDVEPY